MDRLLTLTGMLGLALTLLAYLLRWISEDHKRVWTRVSYLGTGLMIAAIIIRWVLSGSSQ